MKKFFSLIKTIVLLITGFSIALFVTGLLGCITGCDDDRAYCISPGETQCNGLDIEMCTTHNKWFLATTCETITLMDGTQYPGVCCMSNTGAICIDVEEGCDEIF